MIFPSYLNGVLGAAGVIVVGVALYLRLPPAATVGALGIGGLLMAADVLLYRRCDPGPLWRSVDRSKRAYPAVGLAFLCLVGLAGVLHHFYSVSRVEELREEGQSVRGRVTETRRQAVKGGFKYWVEVAFPEQGTLDDPVPGRLQVTRTAYRRFAAGQAVMVWYRPENPSSFHVEGADPVTAIQWAYPLTVGTLLAGLWLWVKKRVSRP